MYAKGLILTQRAYRDNTKTAVNFSVTNHCKDYRTNSMYWDRQVSANSADQDQTASEEAVWSGSTLFAIPSSSFGCINAMLHQTFLFLGQLWQLFKVSQIFEFLR